MRIVICDDNKESLTTILKYVTNYFRERRLEKPYIACFTSAEKMLMSEDAYDIAFLDVELPGISGLAAAKKLKKQNKSILIFIITGHSDSYLDEAFEDGVYRYLAKPVDEMRLHRNLKNAITKILTLNTRIAFDTISETITVYTADIICIQTMQRKTAVFTTTEKYFSKQNLLWWKKSLPKNSFVESHRGIIVNLAYISRIGEETLKMKVPTELPVYVSKRHLSTVKKAFLLYLETHD